jgi:hypothetical protein
MSDILLQIKSIFSGITDIFKGGMKKAFDPNNRSNLIKGGIALSFVVFSATVLYYAGTDKASLMSKTYLYFFLAALPIIITMGYILPLYNSSNSSYFKIFIITGAIVVFCCMFHAYTSLNASSSIAMSIIINFILFLIIIVGLGIFFIIFSNYLKSLTGIQGFVVYLIFYIPCMFIDFFRYILKEFKGTTNDVYVLFLLELTFVLVYIYIPKILSSVSNQNGIVLLENSAFLDIPTSIDTRDIVIRPSKDLLSHHNTINFRQNYAISLWTYLNSEASSNAAYGKESLIFNYGDGKPKITYFNDTAGGSNDTKNSDKYIIYFSNNESNGTRSNAKKITLPSQKWNNLVFNYFSDHVDLFVNGNLELSFKFDDDSRPQYSATDTIDIGSDNGLNGAVCNIRYFTEPLSNSKIVGLYNLLMYKNPPTFV